MVGAMYGAIDL